MFQVTLCAFLCLVPSLAFAQLETKGQLSFHSRSFEADDLKETNDISFWTELEFEAELNHEDWQVLVRTFSKSDSKDNSRNEMYIEEAYLTRFMDNFELSIGRKVLNWSTTEAFHPADVINSRNFDSKVENAQKIGEQMLSVSWLLDESTLTFYYMPFFESPRVPSYSNRLSQLPVGFSLDSPSFIDENGDYTSKKRADQFALKFDKSFASADFSFQYVEHIDRSQPLLSVNGASSSITPIFNYVKHSALTYQQALGDYVFKVEMAYRNFVKSKLQTITQIDHSQFAFGVDYGFVHSGGFSSTFIFELQRIFGTTKSERMSLSNFQNDFLIGYKLDFNDAHSSQVSMNIIRDFERDNETLLSFSTSRRFQSVWVADLSFRTIFAKKKGVNSEGLELFDGSNYLWLSLSRYF